MSFVVPPVRYFDIAGRSFIHWLCSVLLVRTVFRLVHGAFLFARRLAYRVAASGRVVAICSCRSSPRLVLSLVDTSIVLDAPLLLHFGAFSSPGWRRIPFGLRGSFFSRLISLVVRCRCLVIVCGELDGMARVPMIGRRRFPFSRHLVFDTG